MIGNRKRVSLISLAGVSALFVCSTANAEVASLLNGRSANLQNAEDVSAEAGFAVADDYQYIGARVNYKIAPNMVAFGDIGQTESFDADGITFGGGLFYQVDGLSENLDTTVKASFHTGELEVGNREADISNITFQFITSSDKLGQSDLGWYGNLGVHIIDVGDEDDTEIGFGGGVFSATSFGEFFVGINHIDELILGAGARFKF